LALALGIGYVTLVCGCLRKVAIDVRWLKVLRPTFFVSAYAEGDDMFNVPCLLATFDFVTADVADATGAGEYLGALFGGDATAGHAAPSICARDGGIQRNSVVVLWLTASQTIHA
jgi:hypothetical protein